MTYYLSKVAYAIGWVYGFVPSYILSVLGLWDADASP